MTSKSSFVALGAMALIVLTGPALAQSIDLSPVQTLLQGIVDAITGPLGICRVALKGEMTNPTKSMAMLCC